MILTQARKQWLAVIACGLAAVMAVDAIYQVAMYVRWRRWIPASFAAGAATSQPIATQPAGTGSAAAPPTAMPPGAPGPENMPPMSVGVPNQPANAHPISAAIRKRNVLIPARPKGHGMVLTGVLGNTALFMTRQGQPVSIEVGKTGGDIKVLSIDGYTVTIEYEGKAETMKLFPDTRGPGPASGPSPPGPGAPGSGTPGGDQSTPQTQPATTTRATAPDSQPKGGHP